MYLVSRTVVLDLGCPHSVAERKLGAGGGGAGQLPHFEHPRNLATKDKTPLKTTFVPPSFYVRKSAALDQKKTNGELL